MALGNIAQQNYSGYAVGHWADQKTLRLLWNAKVRHRVDKSPQLQISRAIKFSLHFNIILQIITWVRKCCFLLQITWLHFLI